MTFTLSAGCCVLVPTDIALQCPKGVYPRIAPRSSLAIQSDEDIKVSQGQRIAQFVLTRYEVPETVEVQSFAPTERGACAFGSTNI